VCAAQVARIYTLSVVNGLASATDTHILGPDSFNEPLFQVCANVSIDTSMCACQHACVCIHSFTCVRISA
jgi:hypothetical protein